MLLPFFSNSLGTTFTTYYYEKKMAIRLKKVIAITESFAPAAAAENENESATQ
jgi:hypothetical protein